jgi:sec-independent protein translocase protein TatA
MHCLLLLEFIGTTELLVVLIVALVVFGPRKLPELGRSLGRALNQLQAASDDFKRTWGPELRVDAVARTHEEPPLGDVAALPSLSTES